MNDSPTPMLTPPSAPPTPLYASFATGLPAPALPPGTRLGNFDVQREIARSASTVVYLATDLALDLPVAIQEFLPARFVRRDAAQHLHAVDPAHGGVVGRGLRAFIDEARMLAHCDHASLVRVVQLFEANGTAYRVMPFCEGQRLLDLRRNMRSAPDEASLRGLLDGLLGALEAIHRSGHVHGGVTPANILLLADDRPLLLGPGAAGREIASDLVGSLMAGLEPSFGAPGSTDDSTADANQPPTAGGDLYALAAVIRFCITGELPAAAVVQRELEPLAVAIAKSFEPAVRPRYSAALLGTLDAAMSSVAQDRPHSAARFRDWLDNGPPQPAAPPPAVAVPVPTVSVPPPDPFLHSDLPPSWAAETVPGLVDDAMPELAAAPDLPPPPPPPPPLSRLPPIPPLPPLPARPRARPVSARPRWQQALLVGVLVTLGAGVVLVATGTWDLLLPNRINPAPQAVASSSDTPPPTPPSTPTQPAAAPRLSVPIAAQASATQPAAAATPASAPVRVAAATTAPTPTPTPTPASTAAMAPIAAATTTPPPALVRPALSQARAAPAATRPAVTAGTKRAAKPASKAPLKKAVAATPASPRAVCAARTEFALFRCMQTQCRSARWSAHTQCVRMRAGDPIR